MTNTQLTLLASHITVMEGYLTPLHQMSHALAHADYSEHSENERAVYQHEDDRSRVQLLEHCQVHQTHLREVDERLGAMEVQLETVCNMARLLAGV